MIGDNRKREQYRLESQLRRRILSASPKDRQAVTSAAYRELFDRFPDHSVFQVSAQERLSIGYRQAAMIWPLQKQTGKALEIGCGRGDVLRALAGRGWRCWGIEPSEAMIQMAKEDGLLDISHGTADRLQFPDGMFDMVFSQQVIEHLHPDDVAVHLGEAHRVLKPGGLLAVETPNRHTGPQDISRGFTRIADGLHLKEWCVAELAREIRRAGFVKIRGLLAPPALARRSATLHRLTHVGVWCKRMQDGLLAVVPGAGVRTLLGKVLGLDDVFLFARKPGARASQLQ